MAGGGLLLTPLAEGFCHAGMNDGVHSVGSCVALMKVVAQEFLVEPSAFKQPRTDQCGEGALHLGVRAQELLGHIIAIEHRYPALLKATTDKTLAAADAARDG